MAFTGDLENLHIVDIIQLLHATGKSGTFSIKGNKGESRIIFSNGQIVSASHLNNAIRIGTVMVKKKAITQEDLQQALEVQKTAGKDRKPLMTTLMEMGKLKQEQALQCLRKLIEITIVELMGLSRGEFTFDVDAITVSPECNYLPGKMEQAISLDAQMILMDALRIYDERERDRQSGKEVPPYEELFAEDLSMMETATSEPGNPVLTADDLGLGDVEKLQKKIRKTFSVQEMFDPLEIHRRKVRDILSGFSEKETETLVLFLDKSSGRTHAPDGPRQEGGQTRALVLFSRDRLLNYSVMTICKSEGLIVFTAEEEEEFYEMISQCLSRNFRTFLILDAPDETEGGHPRDTIVGVRRRISVKYPDIPVIQLSSPLEVDFMRESRDEGVRSVLPRPSKVLQKETFIEDTIQFLHTLKSYLKRAAQLKN